jgi:hypothetical protein
MTTKTDLATTYVSVVQGDVWIRQFDDAPLRYGTLAEFIANIPSSGLTTVRLLGGYWNAPLIVKLYEAKHRNQLSSLQLGTPLIVRTKRERRSPHAVLYYMPRMALSPSLGGFHEMTRNEYQIYAMSATFAESGWCDKANLLFKSHPLSKTLTFIPTLHVPAACALLSRICDPRWFIDTRRPDRSNKLQSFLGLNPKTQQGVTHKDGEWGQHAHCGLTRSSWHDAAALQVSALGCVIHPIDGSSAPGERPGDFLLRYWLAQRGRSEVYADLRTSQLFVEYLRSTWLHVIYADTLKFPDGAELFRPADFFKYVVEVEGYNHHMLG